MSKLSTTDTRTVRITLGDGREHITVADLLELAETLRKEGAPADARVYRVETGLLGSNPVVVPVRLHIDFLRPTT